MNFEELKKYIELHYNIIYYNSGHIKYIGKDSGIYKNPYWTVKLDENIIILMYCEPNTIIKLCPISYQKILDYELTSNNKITWFKGQNGYVVGNNKLYIHQIITGCYGNGKGTLNISVDHIDQDPLNNIYSNLRIATREEQEQNSKGIKEGTKRARKTSAIDLPTGITQEIMPKYVYYAKEYRNQDKTNYREFFRIEKHPNLEKKSWSTSKSNGISIQDKLKQAINKLEELNKIQK
jgi:hypothetical protein